MKRNYSEYEVSVIQEMCCNIVPLLENTTLADKTVYEVNQIIRKEWFDEFFDYLVANDYLNSHAISISEANFCDKNVSDLDVIDEFCNKKLKEIGYKVLPKFKQADFDTLIEFGIYARDYICGAELDRDQLNSWAVEFDEFWKKHCDEEKYIQQGWLESIDEFLDQKCKDYGLSNNTETQEKKNKEEQFNKDVAFILVQLTEKFSQDLVVSFNSGEAFDDSLIRGEFLFEMAKDIAKSKDWKDTELNVHDVIEKAIEEKKKELTYKNAKFKVGDKVVILYDYEVEEHTVQSVNWNAERHEFWYGLSCSTYAATDHEVYENYIYKDISDLITHLQSTLDENK